LREHRGVPPMQRAASALESKRLCIRLPVITYVQHTLLAVKEGPAAASFHFLRARPAITLDEATAYLNAAMRGCEEKWACRGKRVVLARAFPVKPQASANAAQGLERLSSQAHEPLALIPWNVTDRKTPIT
jgi:hypothetical protein